jgi:hypothetical protein
MKNQPTGPEADLQGLPDPGQFTVYKKSRATIALPKLSSKPHVLQSPTIPQRAAQFTVLRAVLSTTINRKTMTVIPYLIVFAEVGLLEHLIRPRP